MWNLSFAIDPLHRRRSRRAEVIAPHGPPVVAQDTGRHEMTEQESFEPPVADAALVEATARGWDEWVALLDRWGAASRSHAEIARWLASEHGVGGWWAQSITVGYERARGRRAPGQRPDGWSVSASKTVAVPVGRLYEAFLDETVRDRWLGPAELRLRTASEPRSARFDWADGTTRVIVTFEGLAAAKSRVSVQHERLPDADAAAERKAWWRERLTALVATLEASEGPH
jgi:hypothetical protein